MKKNKRTFEEKLSDTRVELGSGNVFHDLGFKNPQELIAKAGLVSEIHKIIKKKKLTQIEAAEILGLSQPKLSLLLRGHFQGYSTDRLMRFLRILGQDVDIFVSPKPRNREAHLHVHYSPDKLSVPVTAKPLAL